MSSLEENQGLEREKAVEELIRGRDCVDRLRMAMENPSKSTEKKALLQNIVASFTTTLSMLRRLEYFDEVTEVQAADSMVPDGRKSEDSGESIRSSLPKSRRGCYKRRKQGTSRDDSPSPFQDDHSWRKYGQKIILQSNHPRSYYRCTHKYEKKCHAKKQVQKVRDEPPVFRTTYYGQHTCRDLLEAPHLILQYSPDVDGSSVYLNFDRRKEDPLPSAQCGVKPEVADDYDPPSVQDSSTASSCGGGATADMVDSFGFADYMDDFNFDFS